MNDHCGHAVERICTHDEHAQFGLGHIRGPRRIAAEYELTVAVPAEYIAPDTAPVLNQGDLPWCESYTAETGRWLTQPPVYQDTFDLADIAQRSNTTANGTTTAAIERMLLNPGALCDSGPGSGIRWPVASCPNLSTLNALQAAVVAEGFAGLAVDWWESWFNPASDGTLPAKSGGIAGGHIFRIKGFSTARQGLYCQNSWGLNWGIGGFFWLPYSMLDPTLEGYTQIAVPLPTPVAPVLLPEVTMNTLSKSQRVYDGPLGAGILSPIQIGGVMGLPTGLKEIRFIARVPGPPKGGWLYAGPTPTRPLGIDPKKGGEPSTLDFDAGFLGNDLEHTAALDPGDLLRIYSTQSVPRVIIDVTAVATS